MNHKIDSDIIGLDLGMARTGVARISPIAKIAEAMSPIDMKKEDFVDAVKVVVVKTGACCIVVGLPRGLDGQTTEQTRWVEEMTDNLRKNVDTAVYLIDEAGTTKHAKARAQLGESVDSVAAGIIVEDFVNEVAAGRINNVSL